MAKKLVIFMQVWTCASSTDLVGGPVIDRLNHWARKLPVWPVYIAGLGLIPWFFWLALTGGLGPEPVKALEHRYGLLALQFLVAGLSISPLRRWVGLNLLRFRRALGLIAFALVCAHLLVWLVLDVQIPAEIWKDITKRPYITIGMTGFALMIPLAVTSNAVSLRKLGALKWRNLHRLTYVVVPLGAIHYVMLVKGWQLAPLVYLIGVLLLLCLRTPLFTRRSNRISVRS